MRKIFSFQIDLQLITSLLGGDVSVDELVHVVQASAAVVLGNLFAVLVDEESWEAVDVLFTA